PKPALRRKRIRSAFQRSLQDCLDAYLLLVLLVPTPRNWDGVPAARFSVLKRPVSTQYCVRDQGRVIERSSSPGSSSCETLQMRVNDSRGFDFGLGETADMLRESVRGFAADHISPRADEIDRSNIFPRDLWPELGKLGVHG